jgi:hypothetical protein
MDEKSDPARHDYSHSGFGVLRKRVFPSIYHCEKDLLFAFAGSASKKCKTTPKMLFFAKVLTHFTAFGAWHGAALVPNRPKHFAFSGLPAVIFERHSRSGERGLHFIRCRARQAMSKSLPQ